MAALQKAFRAVQTQSCPIPCSATEYYAPCSDSLIFCIALGSPPRFGEIPAPAPNRATPLGPPFTLSPTFTAISAPSGSQRSTREPNRTNPTSSPRPTGSPVLFHETTRRATHPAICLKTISPYSLESVKTFCSFSSEALSAHAARNFPGLYSSRVIVPAAGERFTCTFQMARKILILFPGRPAFSSSFTTTTRPSDGDTTTPGSIGILRSGLRKKEKTKSARNTSTTLIVMHRVVPNPSSTPPIASGGSPNQYPSLTIVSLTPARTLLAGAPWPFYDSFSWGVVPDRLLRMSSTRTVNACGNALHFILHVE